MREDLEVMDCESLARLLGGSLNKREAEARESRLRVMQESPAVVARVAPVDEITALAAALNRLDRSSGRRPRGPEVVFADRWAAAAVMGRGDAF